MRALFYEESWQEMKQNLKWLRIKFTALHSDATGWCCFLTGIRSDGATVGSWTEIDKDASEGVTPKNVRSVTFTVLKGQLDKMLRKRFYKEIGGNKIDKERVAPETNKGRPGWEEQ